MGAVATVTAARVFLPDVVRLARRSLAAGVRIGVASLSEGARTGRPPGRAPRPAARLRTGEGERL
jgi:hypothetical protein